jgi:carboxyl-terminal processing protease
MTRSAIFFVPRVIFQSLLGKSIGPVTAILFFALSCQAQISKDQSNAPTISLHDRIWIATQVYHDAQTHFGHWRAVPNVDFGKEFQSYISQILTSNDRLTFDLATTALVAKLQNGHSLFFDRWQFNNYGQPLGFDAYPIGGRWTVGRSSVSGLTPGDGIVVSDGKMIEHFYSGVRQYISAADERWRQHSLFEHPELFPRSLSQWLSDGSKISITRERTPRFPGQEFNEDLIKQISEAGYIRISSFGEPNIEDDAVKAARQYSWTRAIIIDLRNHHGDGTPAKLVDALMDRPYRWFAGSTSISIGLFKFQGELAEHSDLYWYGDLAQPGENPYHGDLYLRVDGGCISACEDFAMPFKKIIVQLSWAKKQPVALGSHLSIVSITVWLYDWGLSGSSSQTVPILKASAFLRTQRLLRLLRTYRLSVTPC